MRFHIILWLWKGWRPIYDWSHVNAMVRMLQAYAPANARILCITDQPVLAWGNVTPLCEVAPLWPDPVKGNIYGRPNCWRRLRIFDPHMQHALGIEPGDPVMSMDLDSVVLGPLSPLFYSLGSLRPTFAAMGGIAAKVHGSLFAFVAGTHAHLWTSFHPLLSPLVCQQPMADGSPRPHGSDQAWMTRKVEEPHLWEASDGCYSWSRHGLVMSRGRTANACYWSFAGPHKPWNSELVQATRPDLVDAYMRALEG